MGDWNPTAELRWSLSPTPGEGQTLQQKWMRRHVEGWREPEEEWRGDPPKGGFHSATEFGRRGEKVVPILRADNKKAKEEIAQLRAQIDRMEGSSQSWRKR